MLPSSSRVSLAAPAVRLAHNASLLKAPDRAFTGAARRAGRPHPRSVSRLRARRSALPVPVRPAASGSSARPGRAEGSGGEEEEEEEDEGGKRLHGYAARPQEEMK